MAADTEAFAHGSKTHGLRTVRRMVQAIFGGPMQASAGAVSPTSYGGAHGVIHGLATSYVSGSNCSVAKGLAVVTGPLLAQGCYTFGVESATTVAFTAHAASPRIDLLCVRVRDDDEDGSGSEDAGLFVIDGTPAGSPSVPAIPSAGSFLVLAEVQWPATSGSPTVTDRRVYASSVGGVRRISAVGMLPTGDGIPLGVPVYDIATGDYWVHNGAGWSRFGGVGGWGLGSTVTMAQGGAVALTSTTVRYHQIGRLVTARVTATVNAAGTTANNIVITTTGLPTPLDTTQLCAGSFTYNDLGSALYAGSVDMIASNQFQFAVSGANWLGTSPALAAAAGDVFDMTIMYEAAS